MKKILVTLSILVASFSLKAQEVMTIENEEVVLNEFVNTLMKNNHDKEITQEYLDEYVELFVNYKLKVIQAKELGLDKQEEFISELEVYRKQLAKPYLQAKEFKNELISEAYNRMKLDVNASHILFRLNGNASQSDTLKQYNSALKAKQDIESGNITFNQAVEKYSDENYNNGNLGWFTAFSMVYPFESAVYNTDVGQISDIVRTQYGYHLVKVNKKRPASGEVKVSHIMFKFPKGADIEKKMKIKLKADEVYSKLQSGEDFAVLADKFSEDRSTAVKGGALPWFGLNKMAKEFEDASFSLDLVGDFTSPFMTEFGWHIVILNDKKEIGTLEEEEDFIRKQIEKGSRNLLSELALIKKLKKEHNFTEHQYNTYRKGQVKENIKSDKLISATLTENDITRTNNDSRELFSIADKIFTQKNFKDFLLEYQDDNLDFDFMYTRFVDFSLLEYEESMLEINQPEYKTLLNEFRDGILLFELTSKKVWTRAMEDTVGLQLYFDENSEKYWWTERVEANIYTCADIKVASKLKRLLWKKSKDLITLEEIEESINKTSPLNMQVSSGKFAEGDNKFLDQIKWIKGVAEVKTDESAVIVIEVLEILEPSSKELNETKGKVISDFQNQLEENWISELREKYSVTINKDILYSIIK